MRRSLLWAADELGDPRLEIAHVDLDGDRLRARGTQVGVTSGGSAYELHYSVFEPTLEVEVVGGPSMRLELGGDADHFDLAYSPLFNSLPVLSHGLHLGGAARDFVMTFVSVPELAVQRSEQRYEPLEGRRVRFSSGAFTAELELDDDGFVVHYPTIARRL